MRELHLVQGSPEWLAHRAQPGARNASEASVMMGESPHMTRNELIKFKATGIEKELTDFQREILFPKGHAVEPALRAYAENIIDDELDPICGVSDDGFYNASFDGVTMSGRIIFEGKQSNKAKLAHIALEDSVPPVDYWQVVHQFATNDKASLCLYAVGDGSQGGTKHVEVRREDIEHDIPKLRASWEQLDKDVAAYKPEAPVAAIVVEVETLPAVSVSVGGSIQIASNLDIFGEALKKFISKVDMAPETDQAFAEAEAAVKTLTKAEEALKAAKNSGLAQVQTVDEMVRTVDALHELSRKTRLALDKMVKERKEQIRADIAQKSRAAWNQHVAGLNATLKGVALTVAAPDFVGAMRGLKTIASLRSAVDNLLAKAKVEANQQHEDMAGNLAIIDEIAADHQFLVRDLRDLVTINPEHLRGVLKDRIAAHEAEQQRKIEAERERIRLEEERKAREKAEREAEAERKRIREEEQAKARAEAEDRRRLEAKESLERAEAKLGSGARVEGEATIGAKPGEIIELPKGVKPEQVVVKPQPTQPATRPTDAQMIEVLSAHYKVSAATVVEWLCEMDLSSAELAA